ncbi:phosphatidate cytidylyltransferase [Solidesulfovibrio alcoholivorans]|uniref:phosphatidate cytidylyltransferase n=1 Tax=Solidesulfovibrio alcoholivorans TaxID=81406 RepID=UPI0004960BB2|nr:phosphatidate cytidylyltransferase [Solidesulfovibrio alcoholivorans]
MFGASFKSRWLTAVVGLPVLFAAVWAGGWVLAVLVAAAAVVGMREYFAMCGRPGPMLERAGLALGAVAVGSAVAGGWPVLAACLGTALWLEQFAFLGRFAGGGETAPPRGTLVAALLYIPFSLRFLCLFPALGTVFVLAVVMAADTGAYFAGHLVGGPKVWPAVSPGKTRAGTAGGIVAAALVAAAFATFTPAGVPALAGCGAVLAVVSQLGDFFESALKRAAGVKDSGALLPGHGGILDRIDGLLPAILAYAAMRPLLGLG